MGSSGGGGGGKAPQQAIPTGAPIAQFGGSSPFDPSRFNSVLPDSVTPMTADMMSGAWARNAAAAPPPPPPPGGGAGPGGWGGMDTFAQQVLDAQKQQRMNSMMMGMGPQGMAYAMQHGGPFGGSMPKAQGPAQQLMLQALQQRQRGGGGTSRMQSSR